MRSILSLDKFTSSDLKPVGLYERYVELTHQDVSQLLAQADLINSNCPACGSTNLTKAFEKISMQYVECGQCQSLFINPRPSDQLVLDYYSKSSAEKFWHENLSRASSGFRQEKIIGSRLRWMMDYAAELKGNLYAADIHTHQDGWIESLVEAKIFSKNTVVLPFVEVPYPLTDSFSIMNQPIIEVTLKEQVDVITAFEVVDRMVDLNALFEGVSRNLKKGGFCFITSILASGFDIQTLWDCSDNLFPPDRLNVLTVEGFKFLFERHGFEVVEFSTPGGLDVDFVRQAKQSNPSLKLPRIISYMLEHRSSEVRDSFQQFLQSNLLSSSGRIVIRKL
jgi:hypothetical protein